MTTPDDGGNDGRKRSYLRQPEKFRATDSELFDALSQLLDRGTPDLANVEASGILANAGFQSEILGDRRDARERYFDRLGNRAATGAVIFFDPDNGLEIKSTPKGRKNCSKFLFMDELATATEGERSVIVYQHFGRVSREPYTRAQLARIRTVLPDHGSIFALAGSHIAFLIAARPSHAEGLALAARELCEAWPGLRIVELEA